MAQQLNILQVDNSIATNLYRKIMLLTVAAIKQIEVANTILAAKEKMKHQQFDFIILDSFMPDGSSICFLSWIKRNYPLLVVILFTNDSDSCFKKNAEQSGADYFLDKSTGFEMLIQIIKKHKPRNKNYSYAKVKHIIH